MMMYPLALHVPFLDEWMVIAFIGLLLFGKRLPEVGRSIGKGIVEFKKGLAGIEDDIDVAVKSPGATANRAALPAAEQTQYKFDPNTGEAIGSSAAVLPGGAKFDPYTGKPLSGEVVATASSNA